VTRPEPFDVPPKEAATKRDDALRRALTTPPKPHKAADSGTTDSKKPQSAKANRGKTGA